MDRTSSRGRAPRRTAGLLVAAAAAALVFAACTGAASPSASTAAVATLAPSSAPSSAAGAYEVTSVQDATLGAFLAGEDGKTLYIFTKDTAGAGKSVCNGTCATSWPPFVLDAGESVKAGAGVTGTFGTVTRDDGTTQVTYQGAPLYYFAKDAKAGDVNGQGVGGVWFVAATAGGGGAASQAPASAAPASPAPASAGPSSTAPSIYDYGFDPGTLNVKVGQTVTWTNTGQRPHTVTADDGSFSSPNLGSGKTFTTTFAKAGTFTFHCAIHSDMKGTVVVS